MWMATCVGRKNLRSYQMYITFLCIYFISVVVFCGTYRFNKLTYKSVLDSQHYKIFGIFEYNACFFNELDKVQMMYSATVVFSMAASFIFGMPVFYLVLLQIAKCSNQRSQSSSKFSKIKNVEARGSSLMKDSKID